MVTILFMLEAILENTLSLETLRQVAIEISLIGCQTIQNQTLIIPPLLVYLGKQ